MNRHRVDVTFVAAENRKWLALKHSRLADKEKQGLGEFLYEAQTRFMDKGDIMCNKINCERGNVIRGLK